MKRITRIFAYDPKNKNSLKKALITVCMVAVSALFFPSCSKDGDHKVFRATAEHATGIGKVSYTGSDLQWQNGDEIAIYDGGNARAIYGLTSGAGTLRGVFAYCSGATLAAGPYTAVYPAAECTAVNGVNLPEVQHTSDGSLHDIPLYAVSNNSTLPFYHTCGVVHFRLRAASAVKLSRIAVSANSNINGAALITGNGTSTRLSMDNSGSKITTLSCDVSQDISSFHDFYMYLPAGTYSSFRILLTAADGSFCPQSAKDTVSIKVHRAKITSITLNGLTFTSHRFSITDTTAVIDTTAAVNTPADSSAN